MVHLPRRRRPAGQQQDGLWLQDDSGHFTNVATEPRWDVADTEIGRGLVLADLNGDGWLDIVKRHLGSPTPMYLSNCGSEAWVKVRLRAPAPNTFAVGAKVRVTVGDQSQIRWIHSGSSGLYTGQPIMAHFGLGDAESIDLLEVIWPDTTVTAFQDVPVRRTVTITHR